ncbi:hypothetical protein M9Y10_041876 [Tritrichomonas musculus]|uniref:DUF2283 domain-containing protein n=1 Tax=Tritrichomonas musculus TaxID=1915356 RepID=A0ABR2K6G6_9EUKA
MTDNNDFYSPLIPAEVIKEVRIYQSKNDPILEETLNNGHIQYSYDNGYIIEEDQEGNIVGFSKMTQDELDELLNMYKAIKKSLEPSIIRAERIKETGIH